ncbi:NIPSNAP family protein [Candidatus Bipolaricaulota bacterium]
MIYEYRVYDAAPGRLPALHARFRDHTISLFAKHGMNVVGFFTSEIGGRSDQLTYILAFENLEHLERAWKSFEADPEWAVVKAESEKDGPIVLRLTSQILKPTPYSPMS